MTGDAQEYFTIASGFHSFYEALTYVGERSIGMPFFDWFFPTVNSICAALLSIHVFATGFLTRFVFKTGFFRSRWSYRFLFVFLCSYPAFVGHTTTPLTDTISVDLSVIAFILLFQRTLPSVFLSGLLSAAVVFLRPSYLIPTIIAFAFFAVVSLYKKKILQPLVLVLSFGLILGAYSGTCKQVYGKLCLQNPSTFEPVVHAQMGLRGGRLLWSPAMPAGTEESFIVPDGVMDPNFYQQCHLKSMAGLSDESLSGCLIRRPHLIPAYVLKKWIGLFDNFRFQPYVENETPAWLVGLSRLYNVMAFVGFGFLICCLGKVRKWDEASQAYLIFLTLLLAEHTLLHPEDRYGLVLVPLSGAAFLAYLKSLKESPSKPRRLALMAMGVTLAVLFVWQVRVWDLTAIG